jgi:hypothetical protein
MQRSALFNLIYKLVELALSRNGLSENLTNVYDDIHAKIENFLFASFKRDHEQLIYLSEPVDLSKTSDTKLEESKQMIDRLNALMKYLNEERADKANISKDAFYIVTALRMKFDDLELRCRYDNTALESAYCKSLELELNKVMGLYKNFDEVPVAFNLSFLHFFSFYKKKLQLAMSYIGTDLEKPSRIYPILNGIVRFNHTLKDDALTEKFNEFLARSHNARVRANLAPDRRLEAVFENFLCMANNEKKEAKEWYLTTPQLEFILKAWQSGDFLPKQLLLNNLMHKLGK